MALGAREACALTLRRRRVALMASTMQSAHNNAVAASDQDGLATERRPVGEEMKKHQMVWVVYPSGAAKLEQGFSSRCQRETLIAQLA